MANKIFSILDNGAAIEPRYTLRYRIDDGCYKLNYIWNELVNLSPSELKSLRGQIDNVYFQEKGDIKEFAKEFKRLCAAYNVSGRLDTREINTDDYDAENPSYMSINGDAITLFDFSYHRVNISKTELISSF